MNDAPPRLCAIVVSYRTGAALEQCLTALAERPEIAEIVVIDNGNRPAEVRLLDHLAATAPRLSLIRPGRNLGFAAGCNLGAAAARTQLLAFVNPDLIVPPGSLTAILRAVAHHPDAWLLGGRLLGLDGTEQRGGRRETLTPWRAFVELTRLDRLFPGHPYFRRLNLLDQPAPAGIVEVPAISGAFMVMARDRYLALGGMDEAMFLHIEDVDLCLRVLKAGGRILYCGDAPVFHHQGTSDAASCVVEWHKTRSTTRYFFKHFRGAYPAWSLAVVSALLWLRWLGVALVAAPADTGRALRRWR